MPIIIKILSQMIKQNFQVSFKKIGCYMEDVSNGIKVNVQIGGMFKLYVNMLYMQAGMHAHGNGHTFDIDM